MPLSPFEIGELASRYMDREPLDTAEVDIQRLIVHNQHDRLVVS